MAGKAKEKKKVWRTRTTDPHPLFEGDAALFWADSAWRADIPRTGARYPRVAGGYPESR